jgi:ubiquinone biosynthesis protein
MPDLDKLGTLFSALTPERVEEVMSAFTGGSTADRVAAVSKVLEESGQPWRDQIGSWIAELLSVERLVPDAYRHWRPMVRDSMAFVASHISDARLAPKIVEQVELPEDTPEEIRLGRVIAQTPGLQKLGQVLARTRRLSPLLRRELQKLENGISDIGAAEVRGIVESQLGRCIDAYQVELAPALLSEASVSAIVEFTWLNPGAGRREHGVFKVMKPHVPVFYAEDLSLLQQLAGHLARKTGEYGIASREVVETLEDVRLLLEREVDFRREQATLAEVGRVYRRPGVRTPTPIPELCTDTITAMSVERGVKVTDALRNRPLLRRRIASLIVAALVADPMFSQEESAVFHADPHAGNLLYDESRQQLIVLDWALTGRLTREQRRQVARLIILMTLRDAAGVRAAITALSGGGKAREREIIDGCVDRFFAALPFACSLGALDAMRLLDQIGVEGVRFPSALVLIRKILFTLDGVLNDIAGREIRIDTIVAREFGDRWLKSHGSLPAPLKISDYVDIQKSALRYASGLWVLRGAGA